MAIAPVIPLTGEPSISSPVREKTKTLYVARERARRIAQETESKYEKECAKLIQEAATELKITGDAARIVQKQTELQTKEKQHVVETEAIDSMIKAFNQQLNSLSNSEPGEVIPVLKERIAELQKRSQEADSLERELSKEINELYALMSKLQRRTNAAPVAQKSRQPHATEQPQESQQSQTSQQLPTLQQSQETRQPQARQRPRRRRR